MSKTYVDYVNDARADIESQGYEADIGIYMDIADSMLCIPEFRALAGKEFDNLNGMSLSEAVAHSLC